MAFSVVMDQILRHLSYSGDTPVIQTGVSIT